MYQEFYANSEYLIWPLMALIFFVLIFVAVLAYVFLGLRDKNKVNQFAGIPLDDSGETIVNSKSGHTQHQAIPNGGPVQ